MSNTIQPIPLHSIVRPHENDVLSGRGKESYNNPGNATYRELVKLNKPLYSALEITQKIKLSKSIVKAIRSQDPPGRFLACHKETRLWNDIGDKKAIEKTSQALREGQQKTKEKYGNITMDENMNASFTSKVQTMFAGIMKDNGSLKTNEIEQAMRVPPSLNTAPIAPAAPANVQNFQHSNGNGNGNFVNQNDVSAVKFDQLSIEQNVARKQVGFDDTDITDSSVSTRSLNFRRSELDSIMSIDQNDIMSLNTFEVASDNENDNTLGETTGATTLPVQNTSAIKTENSAGRVIDPRELRLGDLGNSARHRVSDLTSSVVTLGMDVDFENSSDIEMETDENTDAYEIEKHEDTHQKRKRRSMLDSFRSLGSSWTSFLSSKGHSVRSSRMSHISQITGTSDYSPTDDPHL